MKERVIRMTEYVEPENQTSLARPEPELALRQANRHRQHLEAELARLRASLVELESEVANIARLESEKQSLISELQALKATRTVQLVTKLSWLGQHRGRYARHLAGPVIQGAVDQPKSNLALAKQGQIELVGWAYSRRGKIASVEIWLDGTYLGPAQFGLERPDVRAAYPWQGGACGFTADLVVRSGLPPGKHRLKIVVQNTQNHQRIFQRQLIV